MKRRFPFLSCGSDTGDSGFINIARFASERESFTVTRSRFNEVVSGLSDSFTTQLMELEAQYENERNDRSS